MTGTKNQDGDSEIATLLPRKSVPRPPSFSKMIIEVLPALPTGETWKPVGAVRKKALDLSGIGWINSELP